jgi:hypothetical protein
MQERHSYSVLDKSYGEDNKMNNISVIFADGSEGNIGVQDLDKKLESHEIRGFRRASGWVIFSRDKLRSSRVDDTGSWRDRKCNRLLLSI